MNIDGLVTAKEAAKELGITMRFMKDAIKAGMPHVEPRKGHVYVTLDAVKRHMLWLAGGTAPPSPEPQKKFSFIEN